jgi:hypothetical protein
MSGPVAFEVSKVFNISSTSVSVLKFRKARNICNKLLLNAKTKYYSSISEKIHTETTGSKKWWNLLKSLLADSNNRSIPI